MKILQGVLHEVTHPEGFFFETTDGEMVPVEVEGHVITESPIEVQIKDGVVVSWTYADGIAQETSDNEDVALVRIRGDVPTEYAHRLQNQMRRACFGKKSFKYTPYSVQDIPISTVTSGPWDEVVDAVEAQAPGNTHNAYHVLSPHIVGFCGNAFLNGSRACSSVACPPGTQTHEEGHRAFGRHHSSSEDGEYMDYSGSWMGNRSGRSNWLAAHLYYNGLIDEHEVIHLEDTVRAFLVDPEVQPASLRPGEHKAVFIEKNNKHYCVSYHFYKNNMSRVHVHSRDPANAGRWNRTFWLANLREGDAFEVDGILVKYETAGDNAEVVVKREAGMEDPAEKETPSWAIPDEAYPIRQAYGAWRNPKWTYQGLLVHQIRDEVAATWYTWDRENNLTWFLLQGPIEGESANLTVYATNGSRHMWEDGHAILYFSDENTGMLKVQSEIMGRTAMPLKRLTPMNSKAMNGLYSFGEREGASIFLDNNDKIFMWMFTYTQGMGTIKPSRQRWLHAEGSMDNLTVYEPKDGYPEVEAEQATLEPIGVGSIEDGKFLFKGKEYPLDRLA